MRHSSDKNKKEVPTYLAATLLRESRAARSTWTHRLTQDERERVREGTAEVAESFYGDEDWVPPESFTDAQKA